MTSVEAPWGKKVDDVLKGFGVDKSKGLSDKQVAAQLEKYGPNELREEEGKSMFALILEQFEDLLVRILLGAAVVSFILAYVEGGESFSAYVEPIVILLILILNAMVGVWQESNAEAALEALKNLQPDMATVYRNGAFTEERANCLVPGDIIQVVVGCLVPADARVIELKTTTLNLEQSQLTGESVSCMKTTDSVKADIEIQGKECMLFSSTAVCNGKALAVVTATGMDTEVGKIHQAVTEAAGEESKTPLAIKIEEFGELLAKVIFAICIIVWVINYKHFFDPVHGSMLGGMIYYFKIAVALAVAAIPEGLPAVITTCLALGTRKMAQRNCIVRQLKSVETLGCTTVICSDKTGTLTTNQMSCLKLSIIEDKNGKIDCMKVTGHTYAPDGEVANGDALRKKGSCEPIVRCMSLCNEARLTIGEEGGITRKGEPTEAAMLTLVEKIGMPDGKRGAAPMGACDFWTKDCTKQATLEFSRDRKSMSVLVQEPGSKSNMLYVKGGAEGIIERCTTVMTPDGKAVKITDAIRTSIMAEISSMANDALRVLALARTDELGDLKTYDGPSHKAHKQLTDVSNFIKIEQKLCFLGLCGILDPPRPEVAAALSECRTAGVSVFMITGDNSDTAKAIATQVGIVQEGDTAGRLFTGKEVEAMGEEKLKACVKKCSQGGAVFSRTEPRHKEAIVRALKAVGEVAAMTGDGVNDAPALKQADIGIAMGIAGTEVAKSAADMVLADDNFSTIVHAVEEGRSIYNNMKAFIRYLISSNIGEVASIFFTAAMGIPEGLVPVQLLWVNLVTDGLPATALGFNPAEPDVMQKPPRGRDDPLINGWVFFRYMVVGLYVGFATVGVLVFWYCYDTEAPDGHTLVTLQQLMSWGSCSEWKDFTVTPFGSMEAGGDACAYFTTGKAKASSLSLTVLVIIEMLNALNALSEDTSLFVFPPWRNPYLILACMGSIVVHFIVLYNPFLCSVFNTMPLDAHDWYLVMAFSTPVLLVDEVLKWAGRTFVTKVEVNKRD